MRAKLCSVTDSPSLSRTSRWIAAARRRTLRHRRGRRASSQSRRGSPGRSRAATGRLALEELRRFLVQRLRAVEVALGERDRAELAEAAPDLRRVADSADRGRAPPPTSPRRRQVALPVREGRAVRERGARRTPASVACCATARSKRLRASATCPRTSQNWRSAIASATSSSIRPVAAAQSSAARRLSCSTVERSVGLSRRRCPRRCGRSPPARTRGTRPGDALALRPPRRPRAAARGRTRGSARADREALADAAHEASVDERQRVAAGDAVARASSGEAAGEDAERARTRCLLLGREQVVAPVERRAQRPLARRQVARAAARAASSDWLEPLAIASSGRSFVRAAASSIASGSPSRRRQIAATLPSVRVRQRERRIGCAGARGEEAHGVVGGERPRTVRAAPGARAAAPGTRARR